MKGLVRRFNQEKGYGFIKDENGKDVFFHYSVIQMDGFKTLEENDEVEYEVEQTEKGLKATFVKKI